MAPLVSIVGQASGHYRVEDGEWLLLHSAMAGVRVAPSHTRVRPFVEILGGVASASCCGSETRFALEPGGGVDLPLGDRSAVRLGVSLPLVFADGDTTDLVRVQVAGVFRLGH